LASTSGIVLQVDAAATLGAWPISGKLRTAVFGTAPEADQSQGFASRAE